MSLVVGVAPESQIGSAAAKAMLSSTSGNSPLLELVVLQQPSGQ